MSPKEPRRAAVVYGFPRNGSSYTECLYAAAKRRGIEVEEGTWSGFWLLERVRAGDTLHLHWPSFMYFHPNARLSSAVALLRFIVICVLLKARGARIEWTAHNLYPHDGAQQEWMHRLARRFVTRIANRIYVHGPNCAKIVRREFKVLEHKLRIIPHGHWIGQLYPNTTTRASARQQLGVPESAYVFSFIGLCKPYKGLEALLDAMTLLPDGAFLLIAGKFPSPQYQAAITAQAQRVGAHLVAIHAGFVDDDRVQLFLNAADAVVLPYRSILTSGAAMLAMSFGCPVIAPRLGSLIDFVNDDSGVLYDPTDTGALLAAMRVAMTREFSSDKILKHVSAFTWDDAAQAFSDGEVAVPIVVQADRSVI